MRRKTFKISFYIQKTRIAKDGQAPVLLRVTINGERAVTSVNLKVKPKNWNAIAGKSIANTRIDDELNARIDTIRLRLMQIYREMELDAEEITARGVMDRYLGRDTNPAVMLMELFKEHNQRCHKLVESNSMASETAQRYETSYRHTLEFMKSTYNKEDIPITEVDHKFITDYQFYLTTERRCNNNTTVKYLKNFKKIIRIALANDHISKDPFVNIRFKLEEVQREFLEDHELKLIQEKQITIQRLSQVRDIFVFSCFTGLAFSDLKGLKEEHIFRDNKDDLWIRKKRQKTKNMCNIPLLQPAQEILERYKEHPECIAKGVLLPTLSNQKMNVYIKELAIICGIDKEITTHTGRHTFATTVALANGVSIENVAKMLGHSNTNMTRHYARVLDKSIKRDMDAVNKVFSNTTDSNTSADSKVKTKAQEKPRPIKSQPEIELVN